LQREKLLAVLRLQKAKAIGSVLAKKLIVHVGDVQQIFEEKKTTLQKINGVGAYALQHLFDAKNLTEAEKELQYITKNNIK